MCTTQKGNWNKTFMPGKLLETSSLLPSHQAAIPLLSNSKPLKKNQVPKHSATSAGSQALSNAVQLTKQGNRLQCQKMDYGHWLQL